MMAREPASLTGSREAFWRSLQTLNATRVVISIVLLLYLSLNNKSLLLEKQLEYGGICIAYLLLAVMFAMLAFNYKRHFLLQLAAQISVDICVVSLLYMVAGGAKGGLAILYLLPLAGSAILAPLSMALFFASLVTIFLLAESAYQVLLMVNDVAFMPIGLYGATFFATVLVLHRLAQKLIKQEELAMQRGNDLQIQQAINRLVIADMGDGILVVGDDSKVFTANPAAQYMLGLSPEDDAFGFKLTESPILLPVADAFLSWSTHFGNGEQMDASWSTYITIKPGDEVLSQGSAAQWSRWRELAVHLKLRFAKVEAEGLTQDRTVIFFQNVTEIENQAQQLKLASMGRLTASIAHEVRNPLSAISHAAALLGEELISPTQTRLLNIVGDNVTRVNRIIEDILRLSRKVQGNSEPLALAQFLTEIQLEFQETHELPEGILTLSNADQWKVRFDPLHLREIVVNLLSNAVRYASGRRGSIRLMLVSDKANRLELHVQDDGPGITPEVRAHLFEPFYTTSSKGTGLGLYLARELCLNNGALLDYEYRIETPEDGLEDASGRFVITFALTDPI